MDVFNKELPKGFSEPTALPKTDQEQAEWQAANRQWWETHPMRYDWNDQLGAPEFSRAFYERIDERFFGCAGEYMPWKKIPFDPLIDFRALSTEDVLEIGVGNGSHAALLASYARNFTGIDLTDYAVKSTSERFRLFDLRGTILRADAERMPFPDQSFDFIWSWGVIHHSSNTRQILKEMHRVLRPGGHATTMVYNRSFWHYYLTGGIFQGLLRGDLFKTGSLHRTVQRTTDGGMARYYTIAEWKDLTSDYFTTDEIRVYGNKSEAILLPAGRLKNACYRYIPNTATRFITNNLNQGSFLVSKMTKQ